MVTLKGKFTTGGVSALVGVVVVLVGVGSYESSQFTGSAEKQVGNLVDRSIDQIALDSLNTVTAQAQLLQVADDETLKVQHNAADALGPAHLDPSDTFEWDAVNQFSKVHLHITLPKLKFGDTWIGRNFDAKKPSHIVDVSHGVFGGAPTIWQRLPNDLGYLREASWVVKGDKRQISTFLPPIHPDGTKDAIVAAVDAGETYRGIALVMDKWMATAYEPIKDSRGRIIGMSSAALEEQAVPALRNAILDVKVGKRGQIYSLGTDGVRKGMFFISPGGTEDLAVALDRKDARGEPYIQKIVDAAKKLQPGELATVRYLEKQKDGSAPQWRRARIAYFKDWDWAIVVDAYESDFSQFGQTLQAGRSQMLGALLLVGLIIVAGGAFAVRRWAAAVTHPIEEMVLAAEGIADGDLSKHVQHTGTDELGRLADSFRAMSGSISSVVTIAHEVANGNLELDFAARSERDTFGKAIEQMVKNLREATSQLSVSATEVDEASQAFSNAAEDSGRAATEVAAGSTNLAQTAGHTADIVESMQAGIGKVVQAVQNQASTTEIAAKQLSIMSGEVEQAASAGEEMAATAKKGTIAAQHAQEIMGSIHSQTEVARQHVVALDEKGRQIGAIVVAIEAVATQTNLLALNAAIEAARAGEQGKGFAVVADEVRKLAEESREATGNISALIDEVRSTLELTVAAILSTSEQVEKGTSSATELGNALASIEEVVLGVVSRLDQVRSCSTEALNAMSQASSTAVENQRLLLETQQSAQGVAQAVEEVAAISQESAASSQELSASSEEVSASASELRKMSMDLHAAIELLRHSKGSERSNSKKAA